MSEYLTASDINLFWDCPRHWMYKHQKRKPIIADDSALITGTVVHRVISEYLGQIGDGTKISDAKELIEFGFDENQDEIPRVQLNKYKNCKSNFITYEVDRYRVTNAIRPSHVEHSITAKLFEDLPPFKGIIDYYNQKDATIVDWKTGGGSTFSESYKVQGKIYELLLKSQGLPVNDVYFVNLRDGHRLQMPKTPDQWLHQHVHQMLDMIKRNNFPIRKCSYCDYCEFILDCNLEGTCLWDDLFMYQLSASTAERY